MKAPNATTYRRYLETSSPSLTTEQLELKTKTYESLTDDEKSKEFSRVSRFSGRKDGFQHKTIRNHDTK